MGVRYVIINQDLAENFEGRERKDNKSGAGGTIIKISLRNYEFLTKGTKPVFVSFVLFRNFVGKSEAKCR